MKKNWVGVLSLLLSSPLLAQSLEVLQKQLSAKEQEISELRERIKGLEREVTPVRIERERATRVAAEDLDEDSNRALERALVRERGLLLSSGTVELEPNLVYSYRKDESTGFRRESFGPGLALRVGLPWRSQLEMALPYVVERRNDGNNATHAGIGDFNIGVAHQILNERPAMPGLIGAINYQASTGKNTLFDNPTRTRVALGNGFDSVQGTLTTIKRIDPLVFFGSYEFIHNFAENKNGIRVDPGNSHVLRFGTGLATGPETSLRVAFNLSFFDKTKVGNTALAGSDDRMGLLEFGGSVALSPSSALDVLLGVGVTSNAPDFRITAAMPIRF